MHKDSAELDWIRQIAEEPDDTALRLVCADWYDERGDPRGEFIRLQLDIARGDVGWALEPFLREEDLLRENVRRWNAPLHRMLAGGGVRNAVGWRYRGGFVEELDVDAALYAERATLFADLGPIRRLRLFGATYQAIVSLAECPRVSSVRHLSLRDQTVWVDHLLPLGASPHLEELQELDLRGTGIPAAEAAFAFDRPSPPRILCDAATPIPAYQSSWAPLPPAPVAPALTPTPVDTLPERRQLDVLSMVFFLFCVLATTWYLQESKLLEPAAKPIPELSEIDSRIEELRAAARMLREGEGDDVLDAVELIVFPARDSERRTSRSETSWEPPRGPSSKR